MFDEPRMRFQGTVCCAAARRLDSAVWIQSADLTQLRTIDSSVLFGAIAVVDGKGHRPDHAERSKDVEDRPPAEGQQDTPGDERRHRHGKAAEEMRRALNAAALRSREPKLHAAAGDRKGAGLAQSEKKSCAKSDPSPSAAPVSMAAIDHQDMIAVRTFLGPNRSPNHPAGICPSAYDHVKALRTTRHAGLAQPKCFCDLRLSDRNVAAVHVTDEVHQADQEQNQPAGLGWRGVPYRRLMWPAHWQR